MKATNTSTFCTARLRLRHSTHGGAVLSSWGSDSIFVHHHCWAVDSKHGVPDGTFHSWFCGNVDGYWEGGFHPVSTTCLLASPHSQSGRGGEVGERILTSSFQEYSNTIYQRAAYQKHQKPKQRLASRTGCGTPNRQDPNSPAVKIEENVHLHNIPTASLVYG